MLNLSQPMTLVTMNGDEHSCAATDAAEFDPAGVTIEFGARREMRFFPWSNVAYIRQEM